MRLRYRMAQNATDVIRSTVYAEEPDHTVWLVWLNSMQNCKISVIISYYFLISWQVLPLQLLPATLGRLCLDEVAQHCPQRFSADLATTREPWPRGCQHVPVQVMWSNILGPQQEDHRMVPSAWVHVCSRQLSSAVMNWDILRPVSSIEYHWIYSEKLSRR